MITAPLYVTSKEPGRVLLSVGGTGIGSEIQVTDLINLCVRRERVRSKAGTYSPALLP